MARYKIHDNSSDVITPVGEVLTAEQWLDRYPWGPLCEDDRGRRRHQWQRGPHLRRGRGALPQGRL